MRLLLFLLLPLFSSAQQVLHVVDSASGRGLPYATIASVEKNWVLMTDSLGRATLPDSLRSAVLDFSFVGFRPARLHVGDRNRIALVQKTMPEVVVKGCKPALPLFLDQAGALKQSKTICYIQWLTGAQMAVWVKNPSGRPGTIQTLGWGIKTCFDANKRYRGYPNTPVRLRFYARDAEGCPGEELVYDDIRVSGKKFGWFETPLESFRIPVPEEGLFVVFELIVSGEEYRWKVPFDGPPPPQAITELYGYSFAAHPVGATGMYFKTPTGSWAPMTMGSQQLDLDVQLGVLVCK
ncbi:hypothetical protein EPD60_06825 [Flaviaesturariibacter flavus]|uniref:Carboxypeptidase regulatory-like domain-containing protein n=1 Tax=Flaviaesturariibacter flavus TaxID=2502780 RepID=A0A4R1BII9_9BACT|nr:hypothetical protein [Flaviaesturariibacter flavus]TCJ17017.1 hypothetical protein EPD60_06825 [Flaviaesturariibacter flavus]